MTEGTNGLLADAGDPHDVANKLERLLGSQELRNRLGQAGRHEVLKNRTWQANAVALDAAYGQLVEAPR